MSNDKEYLRNRKHDSIGGNTSGIPPLNEYGIPANVTVDAQKILHIVGDGTRCVWYNGVQITTDKSIDDIAKKLGVPKSSIYVH